MEASPYKNQILLPLARRQVGGERSPEDCPLGLRPPPRGQFTGALNRVQDCSTGWSEVGLCHPADFLAVLTDPDDYERHSKTKSWFRSVALWLERRGCLDLGPLSADQRNDLENDLDRQCTGPYESHWHLASENPQSLVVMPILLAKDHPELRAGALGWMAVGCLERLSTEGFGRVHAHKAETAAEVVYELSRHFRSLGIIQPDHVDIHMGIHDGPSMALPLAIAFLAHHYGETVPEDVCATGGWDFDSSCFSTVTNVPTKMHAVRRWGYKRLVVVEGQRKRSTDDQDRQWNEQGIQVIVIPADPVEAIAELTRICWPNLQVDLELVHKVGQAADGDQAELTVLNALLKNDFPAALRYLVTRLPNDRDMLKNLIYSAKTDPELRRQALVAALNDLIKRVGNYGMHLADFAFDLAEIAWEHAETHGGPEIHRKSLTLAHIAAGHGGRTDGVVDTWRKRGDNLEDCFWGPDPWAAMRERHIHFAVDAQNRFFNVFDFRGAYDHFDKLFKGYDEKLKAIGVKDPAAQPDDVRLRLVGSLAQACGFLRCSDPVAAKRCEPLLKECQTLAASSDERSQGMTQGYLATEYWDRGDIDALTEICRDLKAVESPLGQKTFFTILHGIRMLALKAEKGVGARNHTAEWISDLVIHLDRVSEREGFLPVHPYALILKWAWFIAERLQFQDEPWWPCLRQHHRDFITRHLQDLLGDKPRPMGTGAVLAIPLLAQAGRQDDVQALLQLAGATFPQLQKSCPKLWTLADVKTGGSSYDALCVLGWNYA